MFANFGDKYYGNLYTGEWWIVADGWEDALADVIVWGIEHGVMPYNYLYGHAKLDITLDKDIQAQASLNDTALRKYLARANRTDLAQVVNNYIALPYGIWPATEKGIDLLINYTDPEGRPVRAIFEAGYEYNPTFALAPFSEGFDPFHIPRMAGINASINAVVEATEILPAAEKCALIIAGDIGLRSSRQIGDAILKEIQGGQCHEGVYILKEGIFRAENGQVTQI